MISSPLMTVMVDAVRKAARGLKRDYGEIENLQVSRKGPGNFVSAADRKAEEVLKDALMKARPGYGLILEESGNVEGADKSHTWHVDPLDGTTNFLHGIPHFAISVGLEREGQIVAGVIYDPAKDELFVAERGKGAYLNNRRLRVSGRTDMADALVAYGSPYLGRGDHPKLLREVAAVMAVTGGARRFGSAASISPTSPADVLTSTGSATFRPGTSRPASSWCARPVASSRARMGAPSPSRPGPSPVETRSFTVNWSSSCAGPTPDERPHPPTRNSPRRPFAWNPVATSR